MESRVTDNSLMSDNDLLKFVISFVAEWTGIFWQPALDLPIHDGNTVNGTQLIKMALNKSNLVDFIPFPCDIA